MIISLYCVGERTHREIGRARRVHLCGTPIALAGGAVAQHAIRAVRDAAADHRGIRGVARQRHDVFLGAGERSRQRQRPASPARAVADNFTSQPRSSSSFPDEWRIRLRSTPGAVSLTVRTSPFLYEPRSKLCTSLRREDVVRELIVVAERDGVADFRLEHADGECLLGLADDLVAGKRRHRQRDDQRQRGSNELRNRNAESLSEPLAVSWGRDRHADIRRDTRERLEECDQVGLLAGRERQRNHVDVEILSCRRHHGRSARRLP